MTSAPSKTTTREKVTDWEYIQSKYGLEDVPYGADDYNDPEDFYEDHYDDFWDEEEAEDYWEDNYN